MNEFKGKDPYRPEGFRVSDFVRLREPHGPCAAGARARIVGFYRNGSEEPEALLDMEDGELAGVPCTKLERTD